MQLIQRLMQKGEGSSLPKAATANIGRRSRPQFVPISYIGVYELVISVKMAAVGACGEQVALQIELS
jgi:hypothetical protein